MNFLDFPDNFLKEAEKYGSYDFNIPLQYRVVFKLLNDGDYTRVRNVLESNPEDFTVEYSYLILDTAIEMCLNRVMDESNTLYDDEKNMIKEHTYRPVPDSVEFIEYLLKNGADPHLPENFDQWEHINNLEKDSSQQTGFRFDCSEIRQLLKKYGYQINEKKYAMNEKTYSTPNGDIHYWTGGRTDGKADLVFLPGLTADHRLFEKQIEYFEREYRVFVWDAPGHAASYPFEMNFSLADKAKWLGGILTAEDFLKPVIIGQSMGGYVGQMYSELFPKKLSGFISIDSAPLQRKYLTAAELWLLKRMEPVYRHYPWKWLLKSGTNGVATTDYGRKLMYNMMSVYNGDQARYAKLAGHGFRILAEAIEADLPYLVECPAMLICGTNDRAGSCIRYSKAWHKNTGIRLEWIEGAGHNSNTDKPEVVNSLIEDFLRGIKED